jgi:galactokinase
MHEIATSHAAFSSSTLLVEVEPKKMTTTVAPPKLADAKLSKPLNELVTTAKDLYKRQFGSSEEVFVACAPGRCNLIGEHTDYTGGFVMPFAIDYSTIIYGSGSVKEGTTTSTIRFVSATAPDKVEESTLDLNSKPLAEDDPNVRSWTWYVLGVVAQYLPDLAENTALDVSFAVAGDVPLGSGLSSSAALEVAVARFLECILGDQAFSSSDVKLPAKARALRCQKAENVWCHSPCGIMDQYVSSAASDGDLLLIDCTSFDFEKVHTTDPPSLVITNSNVKHSIGGGEYPVRVRQCNEATAALMASSSRGKEIGSLRDATLADVDEVQANMDLVIYKRAKHVVTENERVLKAKEALLASDWKQVGELMNQSHESMKTDYEVSCKEIDVLVDLAQPFPGVYGSRLTGGGFGGCTVTLVDKDKAPALMEYLKKEYKAKTGIDCDCFETLPGPGARLLAVDTV